MLEKLEDRLAMAVLTVTNTNDIGVGSLRQAILTANGLPGPDRIEFKIEGESKKIIPQTSLPWLEDTTEIDGTSQPGYTDHPLVEIDGSVAPDLFSGGLVISGDNCEIRGLAINNFYHGIVLSNSSGTVIAGNHLGVSAVGDQAIGNRLNGIYMLDSADNLIGGNSAADRNVLSGNGEAGVRLSGQLSTGNRIQGNYIGVDVTGQEALPNKQNGVLVANGASNAIVGTDGDGKDDATEGNIIAGNLAAGVQLSGTHHNMVAGNRIGVGTGVNTPLGNGTDGVNIGFESFQNTIGTNRDGLSDALETNVIAYNKDNGIRIYFSRANYVSGNFIGLLSDGETASPNEHSGVYIDGSSQSNFIGRVSPTDPSGANVIATNGYYGIWLVDSLGESIMGNIIGRSADNEVPMTNFFAPIRLTRSQRVNIGGVNGFVNTIGYSATGVVVEDGSQSNRLDRNLYIGQSGLAIDLGGDGVTANDANDADTGSNGLQNYPNVEMVMSNGVILGNVHTLPYRTIEVQIYVAEPTDGGSSVQHRFLRTTSVKTDSQGNAALFINAGESLAANQSITLNATVAGTGTSEFSARVAAVANRRLELSANSTPEKVGNITGTVYRAASDPAGDVRLTLQSSDPTRASVPAQVAILADAQSVDFNVAILDDQAVHFDQLVIVALNTAASGAIELIVEDNDSPWHNYGNINDVNGDGRVTSIDALLIINELNAGRSGSLAGRAVEFPPLYFDANNDGNVTAIDALFVINALNTIAAGEGEADADNAASSDERKWGQLYPFKSSEILVTDLLAESLELAKKNRSAFKSTNRV